LGERERARELQEVVINDVLREKQRLRGRERERDYKHPLNPPKTLNTEFLSLSFVTMVKRKLTHR
jgi:hypothetical protein